MKLEHILLADELEKIGYLEQLRNLARIPTCQIYWSTGQRPFGSQIIANGTMVFVYLEGKIIGVTNQHVYQGYLNSKVEYDDIECQIGGVRIDLENYIFSSNTDLDLATFKIPEILFNQTRSYYHSLRDWPAREVMKGELIICGGYPGNRRTEKKTKVESDFVSFICRVTEASENHFSIQLQLQDSHWPQGISIEKCPDLGGMSGGPVYRYIDSQIERLEVVGFIYEFGFSDILFAKHASNIDENGVVNGFNAF